MLSISTVESFGSFGLTVAQAEAHAKHIALATKLEPVPSDKVLAKQIVTAVINLMLPSIAEEQHVIGFLSLYGVKEKVVTLAFNSLPPYETGPTTVTTTTKRIAIAKKKITGMSTATKVALGVSVTALVTALILLGAKAKAAA